MPGSADSSRNKAKSPTKGSTFAWSEQQKIVAIPRIPFPTPISDQDCHGGDLLAHSFSARAGDELDSSLAPQLQGNQLGDMLYWHYAEAESAQMGKLMDGCALILREWLKQRWIC